MISRPQLPVVTFLLLLVPGISAASPEAPAGNSQAKEAEVTPARPVDSLKQGMPAATVKKLLGEPAETRPMKAPNGRAEVWVYVREISRRAEQLSVATPDVVINTTEADGSVRQRVTPGQVILHDVQYVTEETIEILLFNDHYVTRKETRGERKL